MIKASTVLSGLLLCVLAQVNLAADWPQWRGPNRDDHSKETGLLKSWPKDGPTLLWTFEDAGIGYSAPSIVGDRLYMLGSDEKREHCYALDLKTQKKLWSTDVGAHYQHGNGSGPRGTPTVEGDSLYCLTGPGELLRIKLADGAIVWKANLKSKDIGGQMASGWGYSESVLVDGDKVLCTPGGKNGALAAFDKETGKVIWRSKEWTDAATYSSIIVAEIDGVKQYVQVTGGGVGGVSVDGKLLWKNDACKHGISVSTPVYKDNHVYVSTGYGVGCGLVKVTKSGDGFKTENVYDDVLKKLMMNHHGGFVLLGDHIYGFSDSKGWICQDFKSGELVWSSRDSKDKDAKDLGKGSLTYADGRFYCYTESGGKVALVDATRDGFKVSGRFTIPKHSTKNVKMTWTHPVVANGKLYLRDQEYLFCYDVSASGR